MLFFDYYFFYAVGYLLHHGGDPYALSQYHGALLSLGYPLDKIVNPVPYPLWSLWIFYLLGCLSFSSSLLVFSAISLTSGCIASLLALRAVSVRPPWLSNSKVIFLWLIFFPFLKCFLFGQLSWIPFGGIVLSLWCLSKRSLVVAGLTLSLLLIKPHLWFGVYGFVLSSSIRNREPRLIIGMCIGAAIQLLASWAVFPFDFGGFTQHLSISPHGAAESLVVSSSLIDMLAHASGSISVRIVRIMGVAIAILFGVWLGMRSKDQRGAILMQAIPFSLLCAPYAWSHDYLVLFPFLLEMLFGTTKYREERAFLRMWVMAALIFVAALVLNFEAACIILLAPIFFDRKKFLALR